MKYGCLIMFEFYMWMILKVKKFMNFLNFVRISAKQDDNGFRI